MYGRGGDDANHTMFWMATRSPSVKDAHNYHMIHLTYIPLSLASHVQPLFP